MIDGYYWFKGYIAFPDEDNTNGWEVVKVCKHAVLRHSTPHRHRIKDLVGEWSGPISNPAVAKEQQPGQLFFAFERDNRYVIAYFPVASLAESCIENSGGGTAVFRLSELPDHEQMPVPEDAFREFVEKAKLHNEQ